MASFVKLEQENIWVNIQRIEAIAIRPQLRASGVTGVTQGQSLLEEHHEATGQYEVVVAFQERMVPVRSFPSQAEALHFVSEVLSQLGSV